MPQGKRTSKKSKTLVLAVSCLIIVAGIFLLPYVFNYYFSPDELIRNTTQAIETLTGTKILIGGAHLSLIRGVTFSDVRVRVPDAKLKLEPGFAPQDGLLLHADAFHVRLHRKGLLGLSLRLGTITVTNPEFRLTKLSARKIWNWQMLFKSTATGPARRRVFGLGPPIFLYNGQIIFTEIKDGRRMEMGHVNFRADAQPWVQEGFYRLSLDTWTERARGLALSLDFNPKSSEILAGKLETIDLRDLGQTLPEPYKGWCRKFNLAGKFSIPEINFQDKRKRATVVLDKVRANVPLSAEEMNGPQRTSLLALSNLSGKIIFTPTEVKIDDLKGRLNNSPCRIDGTYRGYTTAYDNASFNLHVLCENFLCPDYTDPRQKDYIETYIPWNLRCFFHDFKPIGRIDFDLLLNKESDPKAKLTLAGVVQAKNTSAEYYQFPYRLDNLTGSVRLAGGGFQLVGLTGFSGGGKAVVNGTISEASKSAKIDLDIVSFQTPLDQKLYADLSAKYQKIWKKFNLAGWADARVELHQPYGPHQPWSQKIAVSFTNASGCYESFKYPLTEVTGLFRLDGDGVALENITGKNGPARVAINGTVHHLGQPDPQIDIRIGGRNVPIDGKLIDLVPDAQARILRDCRLTGTTDVEGILHDGPGVPLDYKFTCDLKDSRARYKDFPYPLENLTGRIVVQPGNVVLDGLKTGRGLGKITGAGSISFGQAQNQFNLRINADNLPIDTSLYQALDPWRQKIWDTICPTGRISVQADLNREQDAPWDWKLTVGLQKAALRYKTTSNVTDLEGLIFFAPRLAIFKSITGKLDHRWPITLDGVVKTEKERTEIRLSKLNFENLNLTADLLDGLGQSRMIKDLKWRPGGTLSARLDQLDVDLGPQNKQDWTLAGKLDFKQANVGAFDRAATDLDFSGSLALNSPEGDFSLAGKVNLGTFLWNDRQIHSLFADLTKPKNDPTLKINSLRGNYEDGQINGMGKITFTPAPAPKTYGLQLTFDNVNAGPALNLRPRQDTFRGKMRGELFILGSLDQKYIRMGGGTLAITGAEALKIPLVGRIYESLDMPPPNLATFHDITLQFTLEQHKVNLQRIELTGPSISLVGSGTLNLSNDRIALDLIAANPKTLNTVPVLPDIIHGASSELTRIEIHGPVDTPAIDARPLKGVSETLQSFIEGKTPK